MAGKRERLKDPKIVGISPMFILDGVQRPNITAVEPSPLLEKARDFISEMAKANQILKPVQGDLDGFDIIEVNSEYDDTSSTDDSFDENEVKKPRVEFDIHLLDLDGDASGSVADVVSDSGSDSDIQECFSNASDAHCHLPEGFRKKKRSSKERTSKGRTKKLIEEVSDTSTEQTL